MLRREQSERGQPPAERQEGRNCSETLPRAACIALISQKLLPSCAGRSLHIPGTNTPRAPRHLPPGAPACFHLFPAPQKLSPASQELMRCN